MFRPAAYLTLALLLVTSGWLPSCASPPLFPLIPHRRRLRFSFLAYLQVFTQLFALLSADAADTSVIVDGALPPPPAPSLTRHTLRRALPAALVCTRFAAAYVAGISDLVVPFHEDDADGEDEGDHQPGGGPAAVVGGGRYRRHRRRRRPGLGGGVGRGGRGVPPLIATSAVHRYLQRAGRLAASLPKLPALRRLAIAFDADDPVVCTHNEEATAAGRGGGGRGGGRVVGGPTAAADGCASWVKPLVVFQLVSAAAGAPGAMGAKGAGDEWGRGRRGGHLRSFTLVGAPLGLSLLPLVGAWPLELLSVGAIGDGTHDRPSDSSDNSSDDSSDDISDDSSDEGSSSDSEDTSEDVSDERDSCSDSVSSDRGSGDRSGHHSGRRERRRSLVARPRLSPHAALRRMFRSLSPSLATLHLQAPFFDSLGWAVDSASLRRGWVAVVPPLGSLRTLVLSGLGLSVVDMAVLARPIGGVTTLRLVDCWDAPSHTGARARRRGGASVPPSPVVGGGGVLFARLATLDMGGCYFGTVSLLRALLCRPRPLREVSLPDFALAGLPHLPSVLGGTCPSGRAPAKLTFPPGTRGDTLVATLLGEGGKPGVGLLGVEHLVLRLYSLSADAAAAVGSLPSLRSLELAVRTSCRLDATVTAALAAPLLTRLTLRAAFAPGGAAGLGCGLAARSPHLTEVVCDGVWGEDVGTGLVALAAVRGLKALTFVGGDVTPGDPGVMALRRDRPDVRVWFL